MKSCEARGYTDASRRHPTADRQRNADGRHGLEPRSIAPIRRCHGRVSRRDQEESVRRPRNCGSTSPRSTRVLPRRTAPSTRTRALTAGTKELIAVGIAISKGCRGCIASHTRGAARKGVTEEQMAETIGVAIQMGGGPASIYGPQAWEAFKEFKERYG